MKITNLKNQSSASNPNIVSNLNFNVLNIDSRILPLFRTHIVRAKTEEIKNKDTKKSSFNNSFTNSVLPIRIQEYINKNKHITNKILKFYLKGIIYYNLNLKSYILKKNKLNLILNMKKNTNKILELKTEISNFIKQVNKLIFGIGDKNVLIISDFRKNLKKTNKYKNRKRVRNITKLKVTKNKTINKQIKIKKIKKSDTLFVNELKKKTYKNININNKINKFKISYRTIKLIYEFRQRKYLFIHKILKKQIKRDLKIFTNLKKSGEKIITNLHYQIYTTKNSIKFLKHQNKIFNSLRNIFSLNLDSNTNLNLNKSTKICFDSVISKNNNNLVDTSTFTSVYLEKFYKNFLLTKIFKLKTYNKSNLIKIEQTIKNLIKNNKFDYKTDSISIKSNPITVDYNQNKKNNKNNNIINDSNSSDFTTPVLNKYLQIMSKYHKTNKNIYIYYSNIIGFKFNSDNNKLFKNIYKLLAYSFKSMYCLISKPVFVFTSNKIIIQLFYYLFIPNIFKAKKIYKFKKFKRKKNFKLYLILKKRRRKIKRLYRKIRKIHISTRKKLRQLYFYNISDIFPNKFKYLCQILSNLFKKSVEFNLIRLHYPYYDSNILANFLAIFINRIKLRIIAKRLFGKAVLKFKKNNYRNKINEMNILPAFLTGIDIKVAGRLLNNKIIPRRTVKFIRRGAVSKSKINYLDVARYTNKNKRGAYSITVSSGQKFF